MGGCKREGDGDVVIFKRATRSPFLMEDLDYFVHRIRGTWVVPKSRPLGLYVETKGLRDRVSGETNPFSSKCKLKISSVPSSTVYYTDLGTNRFISFVTFYNSLTFLLT